MLQYCRVTHCHSSSMSISSYQYHPASHQGLSLFHCQSSCFFSLLLHFASRCWLGHFLLSCLINCCFCRFQTLVIIASKMKVTGLVLILAVCQLVVLTASTTTDTPTTGKSTTTATTHNTSTLSTSLQTTQMPTTTTAPNNSMWEAHGSHDPFFWLPYPTTDWGSCTLFP